MKKFICLLIVPLLVLGSQVYADSVFSDFYEYGTFDVDVTSSTGEWAFNYYDITTGKTESYSDSDMTLTFNGKEYTAHCLDPGNKRPTGNITCKPINRNPEVTKLGELTAGVDDATQTLAYRIWAVLNERTNQDHEQKGFKQTVEAYSKVMTGDADAIATYGAKFGLCGTSSTPTCDGVDKEDIANHMFGENVALFQGAWSIALAAAQEKDYEYDKYEQAQGRVSIWSTKQNGNTVTIRMSSGGAVIKSEDIQVICSSGCEMNSFTWSNYSGTAEITVTSDDCEYELEFFYPTEGSYECTSPDPNTQTLYTYVDETTTTSAQRYNGVISGDGTTCTNTCCTDEPKIDPTKIFGDVNNCCWDTHSYAYEYALNDLFCEDTDMNIKYWKEKCNVEGSHFESEINDYCKMYCTEKVTVDLPGAVTASSGRYFQLEKNPAGNTTSPYIVGYKRCRVKLDFEYWKDHYQVQITTQINAFNAFQKYDAVRETIDNMAESTSNKNFRIVCKSESSEGDDYSGSDTCTYGSGSNQTTETETWDLTEKSARTVVITGTLYNYKVQYVERYTTIKQEGPLDDETDNYYNEWKIVKDKTPRLNEIRFPYYTGTCSEGTEISEQCLWLSDQNPNDEVTYNSAWGQMVTDYDSYNELMNKIVDRLSPYIKISYNKYNGNLTIPSKGNLISEDSTCSGDEENEYESYWVCEGLDQLTSFAEYQSDYQKFNMKKYINEYMDQLPDKEQKTYSAATSTAKKLEEELDLCTNYFTKTDPNQIYQFNASTQFSYSQTYLDDKGELVRDEIQIPFQGSPGCIISLASTTKVEGEIEDPQYSDVYSKDPEKEEDQIIKITDLKDTTLDRVDWYKNNDALEPYFDEQFDGQKKMTNDGLLQAICEWKEGDNRIYTLAQTGVATETTQVKNFTIHDRQYQVHLTTLEGSYETFWKVQGLGSEGKFDSFFMNFGDTCAAIDGAKETPTSVNSMFTCMLNVEHEVVLTGYCNGVVNGNGEESCDPFKEGYELVNFKVVDPADLFPSVSGSQVPSYEGQAYGHNWVVDEEGKEVLGIIEEKGKEDLTYAPENLSYAFTLTPNDMQHIKNYNESRIQYGGYTDFNLTCDCPSTPLPLESTESCSRCKSEFLENLAAGKISYGMGTEEVSGWANGKESLGTVRNGNNW